MGDWIDKLTNEERTQWDAFVKRQRETTATQIAGSAFVMSLVPGGEPDVQFAVELGLALMRDKPLVLLAIEGRHIPTRLRRAADAIIEVADIDTEAGQQDFQRQLQAVTQELGL